MAEDFGLELTEFDPEYEILESEDIQRIESQIESTLKEIGEIRIKVTPDAKLSINENEVKVSNKSFRDAIIDSDIPIDDIVKSYSDAIESQGITFPEDMKESLRQQIQNNPMRTRNTEVKNDAQANIKYNSTIQKITDLSIEYGEGPKSFTSAIDAYNSATDPTTRQRIANAGNSELQKLSDVQDLNNRVTDIENKIKNDPEAKEKVQSALKDKLDMLKWFLTIGVGLFFTFEFLAAHRNALSGCWEYSSKGSKSKICNLTCNTDCQVQCDLTNASTDRKISTGKCTTIPPCPANQPILPQNCDISSSDCGNCSNGMCSAWCNDNNRVLTKPDGTQYAYRCVTASIDDAISDLFSTIDDLYDDLFKSSFFSTFIKWALIIGIILVVLFVFGNFILPLFKKNK